MSGEEIRDRESGDVGGRPFDAAPRHLPGPRQGCSRMALAGCAAVLVLVGLGVLTLMLKAGDLVRWSLGQVRAEIVRTLPDDLPAAERKRLADAFDAVDEYLSSGDLDATAFQDLQQELMRFARLGRAPTAEEVAALAAALEDFAGVESPPPESSPRQPPGSDPPVDEPPAASPERESPSGEFSSEGEESPSEAVQGPVREAP